jgi:D-tyrosyl-tRNA(Tyr) deacylase
MRAILQRVSQAKVVVEDRTVAQIGSGLLILLGIGRGDTETDAETLADKCAELRIFGDAGGKTNLSVRDIGGEALVVSQFTLYADTRKGRRPSFTEAAPPEEAARLVDYFADRLQSAGVPTRKGVFGAHMRVELINDGPFTVTLESPVTTTE